MKKALKDILSLATSRRVLVIAASIVLFGLRWKLIGAPTGVQWGSFLTAVAGLVFSYSSRPHEGSLLASRRLVVALLAQLAEWTATFVVARYGIQLPPMILETANVWLATWLFGEGQKRHKVDPEDKPVG